MWGIQHLVALQSLVKDLPSVYNYLFFLVGRDLLFCDHPVIYTGIFLVTSVQLVLFPKIYSTLNFKEPHLEVKVAELNL